ncbi:hypothetical protein GCM10027399_14610 [Curvibacter fontanus]
MGDLISHTVITTSVSATAAKKPATGAVQAIQSNMVPPCSACGAAPPGGDAPCGPAEPVPRVPWFFHSG